MGWLTLPCIIIIIMYALITCSISLTVPLLSFHDADSKVQMNQNQPITTRAKAPKAKWDGEFAFSLSISFSCFLLETESLTHAHFSRNCSKPFHHIVLLDNFINP